MSLLGQAALAMWWDMAPAMREQFEDWHTHEHFTERLRVPGFLRASRWASASGGEGFFVMYEIERHEVLASAAYAAHLNSPTPWSTRLMPHHRNMVRTQCHVLESTGCGTASHVLTLRLSPAAARGDELRASLRSLSQALVLRPGLAGVHLLQHQTPAMAVTAEQKLRGLADSAADWVLVATGYDAAVLQALSMAEFSEASLVTNGAAPGVWSAMYALSCAATPADMP